MMESHFPDSFMQLVMGVMLGASFVCQINSDGGFNCESLDRKIKAVITFDDDSDGYLCLQIKKPDGTPIKSIVIEGTQNAICREVGKQLNLHLDRVKILEAGIEAALTHLDQDNFRSAAITHAKSRLEKALKDGRY